MNANTNPELVKLVSEHVSQLSDDIEKTKFENQKVTDELGLVLKNFEQRFQENEMRLQQVERGHDDLQQEQNLLHHEMNALREEQSLTTVKVEAIEQGVTELKRDNYYLFTNGKYKLTLFGTS